MENLIEIGHYVTRAGKDAFDAWLSRLGDTRTQAKIASRIDRLAAGNFGDCKSVRQGLYELRIRWGPGFRIYYSMPRKLCVLLLCGGDKHRQQADNTRAMEYLEDYRKRTKDHEA